MAKDYSGQDKIYIIVSGIADQAGAGRVGRVVDHQGNLGTFLSQYGEGDTAGKEAPDWEALKSEASADSDAFQAKMAALTSSMLKTGGKALPQRIVDATCAFLVKEHNFVISDADPGKEQFYVAKGDLVPTSMVVPNDGTLWTVMLAAPFGLGG